MVNPNMKTPNKKRKSLPNVGADAESPKKTKLNETIKTPGKNKNANSPKFAKTPKAAAVQTNSVKKDSAQNFVKAPKVTPGKVDNQKNSPKGGNKKNKKISESDDSSPKKLKKFGGTSELKSGDGKKKRRGQFSTISQKVKAGDKDVIKELEEKIKAIESRKEITKTAKRKLKLLQKFKRTVLGEEQLPPSSKSQKRRERKARQSPNTQVQKQKKEGQQVQKQKLPVAVEDEDDDESEESSDYEVENEIKPGKIIRTEGASAEEEESSDDEEEEEAGDKEEESGEEEEESGEEEEESGDEEGEGEEESEDEEDASEDKKGKKPQTKQVETPDLKQLKENKIINKTQTRYVVFVGNLPYDATKQEIHEHFKKAGEVRHIRIPNDKKTNKPRGFAYVEFSNETDYQKGLSLHHTFIKGRQINVLYTQGGKKKGQEKKNEVKAKNLKLQGMRKQGQLAGSVKASQKRSARRAKQNAVKTSVNGSSS